MQSAFVCGMREKHLKYTGNKKASQNLIKFPPKFVGNFGIG